ERVEIARGTAKDQVAGLVGLPCLDERDAGRQRMLHHIGLAAELARLLAIGHDRAEAGPCEEGRNARSARAQLFRERTLRREFEFEFACEILALEFLVFTDIGRNHFPDLPGLEQQAQAETVDA